MSRLLVEKQGAIWIAKFHNPPHSFMDQLTAQALSQFLDEVEADEQLRVVILTGSETGVFIRHYDVSVLLERGQAMAERGMQFNLDRIIPESQLNQCLRRIEKSPIPFIAAINGTAMGGGFEMTLACDLRLVQQGSYDLGLPEVNIGLLAGGGGTQRLPRLIGQSRAMELELLGKTLSPEMAVNYGLAMECVEGDVLVRASEIADKLVNKSQEALAHIKQLIRGSAEWSLDEGLGKERTLICDLLVSKRGIAEMTAMVSGDKDIID